MGLSVTPSTATGTDLYGKAAADLQENVKIEADVISGTLKWVTGYTGYSGDPDLQEGNYLALKCDRESGVTVTVELIGGDSEGHPVTLPDDDDIMVGRITSNTQKIRVIATDGTETETRIFWLTGLTLTPEPPADDNA